MADQDATAIIHVINLYALAMDTQRWDLFDRIFTHDIEADFSESAHWTDLAAFKSDFAAYHAPFDSTQHIMMNHLVNAAGDRAQAFTYGSWRLIRKGVEGGDFWEGTGWYDDGLIRTAEGWRINTRVCRVVWWGGNALVNQPIPGVGFDLHSSVLRDEDRAGRVGYVNAICPR